MMIGEVLSVDIASQPKRVASSWTLTNGDLVRKCAGDHVVARVCRLGLRAFLWVVEGDSGQESTEGEARRYADEALKRAGWSCKIDEAASSAPAREEK
jgi:hypothetical protein